MQRHENRLSSGGEISPTSDSGGSCVPNRTVRETSPEVSDAAFDACDRNDDRRHRVDPS